MGSYTVGQISSDDSVVLELKHSLESLCYDVVVQRYQPPLEIWFLQGDIADNSLPHEVQE